MYRTLYCASLLWLQIQTDLPADFLECVSNCVTFTEYVEDLLDDIEDETTGSFQRMLLTLANVRLDFITFVLSKHEPQQGGNIK